jgi:hypothetical protein
MKLDHDTVATALLSRSPAMLRRLRKHAATHLAAACAGLDVTPADLDDNDRAVVVYLTLQKAGVQRSDRQAAVLLRWCVMAEEHGLDDRVVVRIQQALRGMDAAKEGERQAKRRRDKPASSDHDADRNDRIRLHHARMVELDHPSPTSETAAKFEVSRSTVQRILRSPPR